MALDYLGQAQMFNPSVPYQAQQFQTAMNGQFNYAGQQRPMYPYQAQQQMQQQMQPQQPFQMNQQAFQSPMMQQNFFSDTLVAYVANINEMKNIQLNPNQKAIVVIQDEVDNQSLIAMLDANSVGHYEPRFFSLNDFDPNNTKKEKYVTWKELEEVLSNRAIKPTKNEKKGEAE